jgi:predicted hydrocarbon binding protein
MESVLAFIVLASFLDLIGLTVLMYAVGKDLADHDLRIFRLELVEKTLTERIEDLRRKLDELETIKELQ